MKYDKKTEKTRMIKISLAQEEVEDFENFAKKFEAIFNVIIPFSYEVYSISMVTVAIFVEDPQLIYLFAFSFGKHKERLETAYIPT